MVGALLQDWPGEPVVLKGLDFVSRTAFIEDGPTPHTLNGRILARIGELIEPQIEPFDVDSLIRKPRCAFLVLHLD